jgi:hypothetical protein
VGLGCGVSLNLKDFVSKKEVIARLKEPSTHSGIAIIELIIAFLLYKYSDLDIESIFILVAFFNASLSMYLKENGKSTEKTD